MILMSHQLVMAVVMNVVPGDQKDFLVTIAKIQEWCTFDGAAVTSPLAGEMKVGEKKSWLKNHMNCQLGKEEKLILHRLHNVSK